MYEGLVFKPKHLKQISIFHQEFRLVCIRLYIFVHVYQIFTKCFYFKYLVSFKI